MSETRIRISIIGVVALALFGALFARLWYLQVAVTDQFHAAATSNTIREIREPGVRGRILDAKGNVLVDNRAANVITVDRKISAATSKRVIRKLARLLNVPASELFAKLEDPRISPFTSVPVATDVDFETLAYVSEHRSEFPGVRAETVPVRRYPNKSVASHVLGYLGEINEDELAAQVDQRQYQLGEKIGKDGIELTYESDLHGRPGITRVEVDADGRVLRRVDVRPSKPGKDVRLTLDLDVQRVAEDALRQGMNAARSAQDTAFTKQGFRLLRAPAGAVVVLDSTTGSVVALASLPNFDPTQFVNGIPLNTWNWLADPANNKPLLNRAVFGTYAPGSTYKLVSSIAGLVSGVITPNKTINDPGTYAYPTDPDFKFTGEVANGRVDLARALTVSSDVYFYTIGGDLYYRQRNNQPDADALQTMGRQFGFGEATGIALPNESRGRVPDAAWKQQINKANPVDFPYPDWLPGDNIQSAVGQGDILVTPIQMASAYATFANGGTRYSPRLADAVFDVRGRKVRDLPSIKLATMTIPARDTMLAGFTGVVEDAKGTAAAAFAGFPKGLAAGKTGTAQIAPKQNTSWFVGMTPAANPRFVVLAVVEEGGYGAQTAAPIVRAVMEQLNGLPVGPVLNVAPPKGN